VSFIFHTTRLRPAGPGILKSAITGTRSRGVGGGVVGVHDCRGRFLAKERFHSLKNWPPPTSARNTRLVHQVFELSDYIFGRKTPRRDAEKRVGPAVRRTVAILPLDVGEQRAGLLCLVSEPAWGWRFFSRDNRPQHRLVGDKPGGAGVRRQLSFNWPFKDRCVNVLSVRSTQCF